MENTVIIDVRSKEEFKSGHVSKSLNIPLEDIFKMAHIFRKKTKKVIFVCASGNRSKQATEFLITNRVKDVVNGGAWNVVAKKMN